MNKYDNQLDEAELRDSLQSSIEHQPLSDAADRRIQDRLLKCFDAQRSEPSLTSNDTNGARRGAWWTALATAVCLSAVVLLWPSDKAYSFETMLEAIQSQPLVRAVIRGNPNAIGWSRSGDTGVVAVESRNSVYWWDENRNRTQQYLRDSGKLARSSNAADSTQQLLALLSALRSYAANGSVLIESESWEQVGEDVELTVRMKKRAFNAATGGATFVFGLDPESHLPQWVIVHRDATNSRIDLGYPDSGPTTLASLGVKEEVLIALKSTQPAARGINSPANGKTIGGFTPMVDSISKSVNPPVRRSSPPTQAPKIPEPVASIGTDESARAVDPSTPMTATRLAARRWQSTQAVEVPESTSDMVNRVNQRLSSLWASRSIEPTSPANDYELIRRLYLDLAGRVPLVHEIKTARESTTERLVEDLLRSRDFSTHMATVWSRLLLPDSVDLSRFGGVEAFNRWLAKQFRGNIGYDELVRQLLRAEGRVGQSGPVLFYTALEMKPDHLAKQTARVFLGARIDCAQCHDHPTDDWTQQDFWAYAAFFARISRPTGRMQSISPVLRVRDVPRGDVMLPDTNQIVTPRFLGGEAFVDRPGEALRRKALADWLTSSRQFARATVNHVWTHFFGVGFVDPSDDFGPHNPALEPELLDELAEFLIEHGYDLRELTRVITATKAYRASGQSDDHAPDRLRCYAQMNTKWLTAEQLYDALTTAARSTQTPGSVTDPVQRFGADGRDAFIQKFKAPRGTAIEYQAGIPQALAMMNGGLTLQFTEGETSGMMKALTAPFLTDQQRLETLFLACVGRPANDAEQNIIMPMLAAAPNDLERQYVLSDLFWALLNTAEFATNH